MKSTSEQSYGSILERAKGAVTMVEGFANFQPAAEEAKPGNLKSFFGKIEIMNTDVQQKANILSEIRNQRVPLYFGNEGLVKRSSLVREYFGSLTNGSDLPQYKTVQKSCQKMQNYHPPQKEKEVKEGEPEPKTISKSETGFGALLLEGKKVVAVIKQFPNYNPVNPLIQRESMDQLITNIEAANEAVNKADTSLSLAQDNRAAAYATLPKRIQQLKKAVSSQYGKDSKEYQMIVKVKV
jgi:hypothetical protein